MKKVVLLLSVLFMLLQSYGQSRLGHTSEDIKKEFRESKWNLKEDYDEDGVYNIRVENNAAIVRYVFQNDLCTITFIKPKTKLILNHMIKLYNKEYVIVSSTSWKIYEEGYITDIELIHSKNDSYYFVWSINLE